MKNMNNLNFPSNLVLLTNRLLLWFCTSSPLMLNFKWMLGDRQENANSQREKYKQNQASVALVTNVILKSVS